MVHPGVFLKKTVGFNAANLEVALQKVAESIKKVSYLCSVSADPHNSNATNSVLS
jgi:hypothetical protein